MEWEEFLKHPRIMSYTEYYLNQPPGRYLYGKLLHDSLECLNGYKSFIKIANMVGNIPDDTQQWFLKWDPVIEAWILDYMALSETQYKTEALQTNRDWPTLIAELTYIPEKIALLYRETQTLNLPATQPVRGLLQKAISSIARLNLICSYIRNQEYMLLWGNDFEDL